MGPLRLPPKRGTQSPGGWLPPQHAGAPPQQAPSRAAWQPPPPGWQPQPQPPDNNPAVAGFVLALTAIGLLVLSAGLSSIFSVGCACFAIFYSLRGRRRVHEGLTPKHRGLAQAGFIVGIVGLVLALIATALWIALLTSDEFWDDLDREFDDEDGGGGDGFETKLRLAAALARACVLL